MADFSRQNVSKIFFQCWYILMLGRDSFDTGNIFENLKQGSIIVSFFAHDTHSSGYISMYQVGKLNVEG